MGIRINQNIMAMNSYRNLTTSESQLSKSLEKLSSGFRINKAADDASGLVISEGLRSQVMGLKMAIKNTQDGISVVQTAEGALTEVHSLLQRIRELAVQASSTGSSDQASRDAAQAEVSQLLDEVDRISNTTRFGGQTLLNGTYGSVVANSGSAAEAAVAAAITGSGVATNNFDADFTGAGARQFILSLDGGPGFTVDFSTNLTGTITDMTTLESEIQGVINAALTANGFSAGDVDVSFAGVFAGPVTLTLTRNSSADGTSLQASTAGSANNDTFFTNIFGATIGAAGVASDSVVEAVDEVAGNFASQNGAARVVGDAVPTGALLVNYQGLNAKAFAVDASSLNGGSPFNVVLDFNATGMTREQFEEALQAAVDEAVEGVGGEAGDLAVDIIHDGAGAWQIELRTKATGAGTTLTIADADGPDPLGVLDSLFDDVFGATPLVEAGNDSGGGKFQVGASAGETISFVIGDTDTAALSIDAIDVATDAEGALSLIDQAIEDISVLRGDLGALQNRFEHTINNLSVTMENLSASESRIRDTDMAAEMMQFTRSQILQQAGTAMLAQANAVPQSVLQLLQ